MHAIMYLINNAFHKITHFPVGVGRDYISPKATSARQVMVYESRRHYFILSISMRSP